MASTAFFMEAAKKSLREEGFLDLDDSGVGNIVLEMEKRNFQYLSLYGLDYCKQYVLGETVSITGRHYGNNLIALSVSDLSSNPSSANASLDIG